jgi:hypothetical protein
MIRDRWFDPIEVKGWMIAPTGVARQERKSIAEVRLKCALGSNGESMITNAVQCILVGLFDDAQRLLTKADKWLSIAIKEKETPQHNYGEYATEASRFANLHLCRWLLHGRNDVILAKQSIEHWNRWLAANGSDKGNLTLLLPLFIEARACRDTITHFDATRGMAPPEGPQKATRQAQVCYVLAKRRLGEAYQDVDEVALLERFFKCHVDPMLAESQYKDVARWMKIAHWQEGDDPFATVLRCYDYLPYDPPAYPA